MDRRVNNRRPVDQFHIEPYLNFTVLGAATGVCCALTVLVATTALKTLYDPYDAVTTLPDVHAILSTTFVTMGYGGLTGGILGFIAGAFYAAQDNLF